MTGEWVGEEGEDGDPRTVAGASVGGGEALLDGGGDKFSLLTGE